MYRLSLLLSALSLASGLRAQLVNPGFENGLQGWQTLCSEGTEVSFDTAPYGGGTMSARIRCLSGEPMDCWIQDQLQPMIYQPLVGAHNGGLVHVSAWVKAEPDVPSDQQWVTTILGMGWIDGSGHLQYSSGDCAYVSFGGGSDWTLSSLTCTLSGFPSGVTPMLFLGGHAYNNTNGHVLIDNVHIALGGSGTQLSAKAWLDGAFVPAQNLMRDDLRAPGLIPLSEPNSAIFQDGPGGETIQPAVLAVTGNNAIVDWVRVELHLGPYLPGYSRLIAKRNALIQRDGDIVDVDGVSPVSFNTGPGHYHVAVRHRNHLSVMQTNAVVLNATATTLDFRAPGLDCFTRPSPYNDLPRRTVGTTRTLWSGNVDQFGALPRGIYYTGLGNDRDPILQAIGGVLPTATFTGYHRADVNLDGVVKYAGPNNDRDIVLQSIGGVLPTAVRYSQAP